ncbi:Mor transcription activator family protein [Pasteurella sp. PK-2025]|uniref:Mor transcription activator family protein n=1 Tax=Pasteurella sp. PK-2025 TaxID=3413133 RepID=UPI003C7313B5
MNQSTHQLDNAPQNEVATKWPSLLGEMLDVVKSELLAQGMTSNEAMEQSKKIIFAISSYFGGQSVYLPTGTILKKALRNYEIFNNFKGDNIKELIRKYQLSESQIYSILREQRQLQRKRNDEAALH